LRLDGIPYANARNPDDPGAAVFFQWRGRPFQVACDSYRRVHENIRAIFKTIEAMRTIERHGATQLLERAVQGFTALPPGADDATSQPPQPPWWEVIETPIAPELCAEICNDDTHFLRKHLLHMAETCYKVQIRDVHPDRPGGSAEMTRNLNLAIRSARAILEPPKEEGTAP
jgi:hypothetical protein